MATSTQISLADLDNFAHGAPWELFAQLRQQPGLHWSDEDSPNQGFHSAMRYHDIVRILRDPETFTSEKFTNLEEVEPDKMDIRRSLLETDGARHRAMRRLIQFEFTPGNQRHCQPRGKACHVRWQAVER